MTVKELLATLTHLTAQEAVRLINIDDPTERLKEASKFYVFSYFARMFGETALICAGEDLNLDPDTLQDLRQQLQEISSDNWDSWIVQAKNNRMKFGEEALTPKPDGTLN